MAKRTKLRSIETINAEISALMEELKMREEQETLRIAEIVRVSGLGSLGLSDNQLRIALEQIAHSFRESDGGSGSKPVSSKAKPAKMDTTSAAAPVSSGETGPHENR
ncbi:TraC family protein [Ochrobactrum sp. GPK 3]